MLTAALPAQAAGPTLAAAGIVEEEYYHASLCCRGRQPSPSSSSRLLPEWSPPPNCSAEGASAEWLLAVRY